MKTIKVLILILLIPASIYPESLSYRNIGQIQDREYGNVMCITIPKCGTNLLRKLLSLLEIPGIKYDYSRPLNRPKKIKEINKHYPPNHYKGPFHLPTKGPLHQRIVTLMKNSKFIRSFNSHWTFTPEFEEFLYNNTFANFFIIRDPRDQVVSMAHMMSKGYEPDQIAPVEAILWDLIDGRQQNFVLWGVEVNGAYPLEWEFGVTKFFRLYLPWMNARKFLFIHFENLVGPLGGGTLQAQLQEIKKIAEHLHYPISDEKALKISQELFGDSKTFREGQIGSWKKHFTPEMKTAFKAAGGDDLLIELGYEKDNNW